MLAYDGQNVCVCKRCGADKSTVYASGVWSDEIKRRYRKCLECGFRWSTVEIDRITWLKLMGEQKDGSDDERQDLPHPAG